MAEETAPGTWCQRNPGRWKVCSGVTTEGQNGECWGLSWQSRQRLDDECPSARQVQEWNACRGKDAFEGQCGAWLNKSLFKSFV